MGVAASANTQSFAPGVQPRLRQHSRSLVRDGWVMELLLGFSILSLFTSLKLGSQGEGFLRPLHVLTAVAFIVALARAKSWRDSKLSVGLIFLVPFFLCHTLSSFTVDRANGIRETFQILVMSVFAITVSLSIPRLDYFRLGRILLFGMTAIMAYSVYWHVSQGFITGWKRLNEPKATFTFLPLVLAVELAFSSVQKKWKTWLFWAGLGAVILQSGERKALISAGILTVALLSRGRILVAAVIVAAGIFGLSIVGATTTNPYLAQQIQTVLDPFQNDSYSLTRPTDPEESVTNAARFFAADLSKQLIAQHPLFGVGTNDYVRIVQQRFAYLPEYMQLGIHGEFLRVPTENGFVGLAMYLLIWIASFVRTVMTLLRIRRSGLIGNDILIILPVIFLVPFLFYIAFEAPGTHSFVIIILVSLLPDILQSALPRYLAKNGAVTPSPRSKIPLRILPYPYLGAR